MGACPVSASEEPSAARSPLEEVASEMERLAGIRAHVAWNTSDWRGLLRGWAERLREAAPPPQGWQPIGERCERLAIDMEREAALWPKNERAQQVARMLRSLACDVRALPAPPQRAEGQS